MKRKEMNSQQKMVRTMEMVFVQGSYSSGGQAYDVTRDEGVN